MKETVYKIGMIIFAIAFIVIAFLFWLTNNKLDNALSEVQIQKAKVTQYETQVKYYINENGKLINQVELLNIEKKNTKDALEAAGFEIDSLKMQGIRLNRLLSFYRLELEVANQGTGQIIPQDTTEAPKFKKTYLRYNDGVLSFIEPKTYLLGDKLYLNYSVNVDIDVSEQWDRSWLLGKKNGISSGNQ